MLLNLIWLILILLGTLFALGRDVRDMALDRFRNGAELTVSLECASPGGGESADPLPCTLSVDQRLFQQFYGLKEIGPGPIQQSASLRLTGPGQGMIRIRADRRTPPIWNEIRNAQRDSETLQARLRWDPGPDPPRTAMLSFNPIRFASLSAVTQDGILRYARVAVELAIGLIGIMALWLGLMKIAEQAGLIEALARLMKPLMVRLFPQVPPEHPAMGAMIMNISANLLGLGNAATPLGLKAMEELNRLNPNPGRATDAMCTFLVINTSNVQLIPAAVIAVRAASGSADPTEIIAAAILATAFSTLVGLITVKWMARWKLFRRGE